VVVGCAVQPVIIDGMGQILALN